jgi:hypothetical protein
MPGGAVTGRHVWVSGFVGQDAVRTDLPEFTAWALIYQAEAGESTGLPQARASLPPRPGLSATSVIAVTHKIPTG